MNINGISPALVNDWITSQLGTEKDNIQLFASIAQMTDDEKANAVITYLTNRASNDNTKINNLNNSISAQTDVLNADISACNAAIATIQGS